MARAGHDRLSDERLDADQGREQQQYGLESARLHIEASRAKRKECFSKNS